MSNDKYLDRKISEQAAVKILKQQKMDRILLDNKNLSLENQELKSRLKAMLIIGTGHGTVKKRVVIPEIAVKVNEKFGL